MKKSAFTLIEVLVVISVIGLLMGVLLPALRSSRQAGQQIVCASNLRQIMVAVHLYSDDNSNWLPMAEPPGREFPHPKNWFMNAQLLSNMDIALNISPDNEILGPATKPSLLTCPADQTPRQWRDGTELNYALSYGMNGTWGAGGRPDHTRQRRLTEFRSPSNVMGLTDASGEEFAPGIVLYHSCPRENVTFRHRGRTNAVFLDGHTEPLKKNDIPWGFANRNRLFWSP